MIAVDTNVLLRLLLQDDARQHAKVHQLFLDHADEVGAIWVSDVVLVEVIWVLRRTFGRSREEVSSVLEALIDNTTVQLASRAAVRAAIQHFRNGQADFADCLLAVQARDAGAEKLHTFDRKMRGLPGVSLL